MYNTFPSVKPHRDSLLKQLLNILVNHNFHVIQDTNAINKYNKSAKCFNSSVLILDCILQKIKRPDRSKTIPSKKKRFRKAQVQKAEAVREATNAAAMEGANIVAAATPVCGVADELCAISAAIAPPNNIITMEIITVFRRSRLLARSILLPIPLAAVPVRSGPVPNLLQKPPFEHPSHISYGYSFRMAKMATTWGREQSVQEEKKDPETTAEMPVLSLLREKQEKNKAGEQKLKDEIPSARGGREPLNYGLILATEFFQGNLVRRLPSFAKIEHRNRACPDYAKFRVRITPQSEIYEPARKPGEKRKLIYIHDKQHKWLGAYNDHDYVFSFDIPPNYPAVPPTVRCMTPIFHPYVSLDGQVGLKMLTNCHLSHAPEGLGFKPYYDLYRTQEECFLDLHSGHIEENVDRKPVRVFGSVTNTWLPVHTIEIVIHRLVHQLFVKPDERHVYVLNEEAKQLIHKNNEFYFAVIEHRKRHRGDASA
eukprot:Gb_11227 [translate_table: standard]